MNVLAIQDGFKSLHYFPLCQRIEHRGTRHGGFAKQQHALFSCKRDKQNLLSGEIWFCFLDATCLILNYELPRGQVLDGFGIDLITFTYMDQRMAEMSFKNNMFTFGSFNAMFIFQS